MAVNVELLMTYWEIGAFLSPRIHSGSWSTAVVGQLADYLKRQDPTLRGYGKSNLCSMALVYDTFSTDEFLALVERYSRVLRLENIFQPVVGKCLPPTIDGGSLEIFQPVVGKSLPQILASMSFSNLTLIASHCHEAQECPVMVAQYKQQFIPKEVLQRTFEEYLALPDAIVLSSPE